MKTYQPTDSELYHFDTFGYVVIEDAIPEDRLQRLQRSMRAWDEIASGPDPRMRDPDFRVPTEGAGVRAKMMHPILKNADCAWLAANPRLLPLLDALVRDIRFKSSWADWKGRGGGQEHHSNHTPFCHADSYAFQQRICATLVTVCYAIEDIAEDGGALELIPGSHKANFPLPADAGALQGMRRTVLQRAGSAIVFSHDANHGSLNRSDQRRVSLFMSYTIGSIANSFAGDDLYASLREQQEQGSWSHYLLRSQYTQQSRPVARPSLANCVFTTQPDSLDHQAAREPQTVVEG